MIWYRLLSLSLLMFLSMSLTACSITEVVNAKPSTSAPGNPKDITELYDACQEAHQQIDDWESEQQRKIEDEWIEGKREWAQTAAKISRMKDEASDLRWDLHVNCNVKHAEDFPGPLAPNVDGLR